MIECIIPQYFSIYNRKRQIFMGCCITDMRNKEVICQSDGTRLGNVDDIEFDTKTGQITCIIIYGRGRPFGKGCDIKIPWDKISVVGEDTILVDYRYSSPSPPPKKRFF